MNTKMKRRLTVVTGVIAAVLVVVLAVVGSGGSAKTVTVSQVVADQPVDRIQVSGNVVDNSFATKDNVLTFEIYDPEGDPSQTLAVRYDGAASSTFGNGVTAICTGKLDTSDGVVLVASELVTKCPSKYESATDALSVAKLLEYGDDIVDTTVKMTGVVKPSTLAAAGASDARFVLVDAADASREVPVAYDGALPETITDNTAVVVTGSLSASGAFEAADVAQEG